MGKRKNSDGNAGKTAGVSITLSLSLIDKLDERVKKDKYASRSELIENACNVFLELIVCDHCGTLNPKGATRCAICNVPINEYSVMFSKAEKLLESIEKIEIKRLKELLNDVHNKKSQCENLLDTIYNKNPEFAGILKTSINYMNSRYYHICDIVGPLEIDLIHSENGSEINDYIEEERESRDDDEYDINEGHVFWKIHGAYLNISGIYGDPEQRETNNKGWWYVSQKELSKILDELEFAKNYLDDTDDSLRILLLYYGDVINEINNMPTK